MIDQLAVIGCGNWGQNLVRIFCEILGPERVVCCDTRREVTDRLSAMYPGLGVARDPTTLWDLPSISAVSVATPAPSHYAVAKRALLAGKHVFVEKPMTTHAPEAVELCDLAVGMQRVLMVDHLLLFHPAVEEIERRVKAGEIGEIYGLYGRRTNLGVIRTEENVLWSLGPHDISVMISLMGVSPVQVAAQGGAYVQAKAGIHDFVYLTLLFPGGQIGHLHLSWLDPRRTREITVVGSHKMVVFDDAASSSKLRLHDVSVEMSAGEGSISIRNVGVQTLPISDEEPLTRACQHFLTSIERGYATRSTGMAGAEVVLILEAAQESLDARGEPVRLEKRVSID